MEDGATTGDGRGPHALRAVKKEAAINAENNSAWIRRHLRYSIYLWACGENADDDDDDPQISDRLIGWLILLLQGFAYTMLIVLAGTTSTSDTGSSADDSGESGYLLPSVTGAMYLLIASTTHDLRAGFSLLVDGSCAGHRAFGIGLLTVYGIMITAAMTVLVSTSEDSASVVLNAVTVLFIADLDEKALQFLRTVPTQWRLFWAIQSIGISFALALLAVIYMGDSSPLLEANNGSLQTWPTWFIWGLNPVGVTLSSVLVSSTLQAVCEFWSEACGGLKEAPFGLFAILQRGKERFRGQPCFYVTQGMWLAQGVVCWFYAQGILGNGGFPVAFDFDPTSEETSNLVLTVDNSTLICMSTVLATGLATKIFAFFRRRSFAPRNLSESGGPRGRWGAFADSRVPSLLVGWGIGYWVISTLYVLGTSWHGGGLSNAPLSVTLVGYVIVPCFLVAGILMVADTNFLGTRVGAFVKPAVGILNNRGRVECWIMVTVYRDMLIAWMALCGGIRYAVSH